MDQPTSSRSPVGTVPDFAAPLYVDGWPTSDPPKHNGCPRACTERSRSVSILRPGIPRTPTRSFPTITTSTTALAFADLGGSNPKKAKMKIPPFCRSFPSPDGRWPGHKITKNLCAPFIHSFIVDEWETTNLTPPPFF